MSKTSFQSRDVDGVHAAASEKARQMLCQPCLYLRHPLIYREYRRLLRFQSEEQQRINKGRPELLKRPEQLQQYVMKEIMLRRMDGEDRVEQRRVARDQRAERLLEKAAAATIDRIPKDDKKAIVVIGTAATAAVLLDNYLVEAWTAWAGFVWTALPIAAEWLGFFAAFAGLALLSAFGSGGRNPATPD